LKKQTGAQFYRCALQVNPHHYAHTFRGQDSDSDASEYVSAMVQKAEELDISVLAITDHNSVRDIKKFKAAANEREITVFPGFELSSSEGVHILCIYPQNTEEGQLERYLGEFGITCTEPSSDLSDKSLGEILTKVREKDGVTIAAHVTNDKGLFQVLEGKSRINAWKNDDLLAIQIPGPLQDLSSKYRRIILNEDPNYTRDHIAGENQAVAVINAKDVSDPEELADSSATCWIKMSQISIEGLRQAFLDPDSRIRLNGDLESEGHAEFLSLSWESGFLDGTTIRFNPNLNVLVGGRGAGKSTIVESLRHVLSIEPIGEESRKIHTGIVLQVLRPGTKISLRVRTYRPSEREYLIERIIPNPSVVRDGDGQILNLLPKDIFPNVEIYGQHELSELTRSPEKLTLLLHRFMEHEKSLSNRKISVKRRLEQNRKAIIEVNSEFSYVNEQLGTLPSLEETLTRYEDAGLEDLLKNRSLLIKEEGILDSIPDRVKDFREWLEISRQNLPIDCTFLSSKVLDSLPGGYILKDAVPSLERLSSDLIHITNLLDEAFGRFGQDISNLQNRWGERKDEVEIEYQNILRELNKSATDGADFIRLRSEIERLRPLKERQGLLRKQSEELEEIRRGLLVEWEEVKAQEFRLLDGAATKVNCELKDHVSVKVKYEGDREPFYQTLRTELGGRLSEAIDRLKALDRLSLSQFVSDCRDGAKIVQESYSFTSSQAERFTEASPEVLMMIEELELPSTTTISLNTAPMGDLPFWQDLKSLSTGQKATAVLLLLLLESDAPLVIDQPEDDLDNRFITDGIVPRMRKGKPNRQFVFSTHNANIPVLGDAELILGLTASGGADGGKATIDPEHMGAIDVCRVRELVEEVLEGGKEAFETRRRKYGF